MGRLSTPVRHELVLDGLNEIRPFELQKDVGRLLSLPVINRESATQPNKATGKLLRCKNGAVAADKGQTGFLEFENIGFEKSIITDTKVISLAQPIYGFSSRVREHSYNVTVSLANANFDIFFTYTTGEWVWTWWYGDKIYLSTIVFAPPGWLRFNGGAFFSGERYYGR